MLATLMPLLNGVVFFLSTLFTNDTSDRFIFAVFAASISYKAVQAVMKTAVPKATPGSYLLMAIGVTFFVNITIGSPLYFYLANAWLASLLILLMKLG